MCAALQEEALKTMKNVLNSIKLQERGVYVQASTLGSLEALVDFLKTSKVPVSMEENYCYNIIMKRDSIQGLVLDLCTKRM